MSKYIYFVGKLPPPIGGVTVFNQRKVSQLQANGLDVVVIEPLLRNSLIFIKFLLSNKDCFYLSASNYLIILMILVFGSCSRVIFYDHNSSRHLESYGFLKRIIYCSFFRRVKKIVLVNAQLANNYKIYNFYDQITFDIESAFLPPPAQESDAIIATYPTILQDIFVSDNRTLVIASAFKPNKSSDGKDIYSLRETILVFSKLSSQYSKLTFVISIAHFPDDEFSRDIRSKIDVLLASRNNVILLDSGRTLWPLFKRCLLYIRPTTTDGDAISVREALYFEARVLASDVVARPSGTYLFNLEKDSLLDAMQKQLEIIVSE